MRESDDSCPMVIGNPFPPTKNTEKFPKSSKNTKNIFFCRDTDLKLWKMKRKREKENLEIKKREKSDPVPKHGIGGDHPAWDIIIGRLDFKSQMKMSQQNRHLAKIVELIAESKLRKYRRQFQEDKYM